MGNRYKRMVTLGMISFTALLAWGYCMLAYRSQAVYVAIISLVLVGRNVSGRNKKRLHFYS